MMDVLIRILHEGDFTLVLKASEENGGELRTFTGRGVSDLFRLLKREPGMLAGAMLADKVTGKGAAALMIMGGIREVHTDVISEAALELFKTSDVKVDYDERVEKIWNRTHTDGCPVEKLCRGVTTAEACIPLIEDFVVSMHRKSIG